jgi:DNA polymerase-3 subunit delta
MRQFFAELKAGLKGPFYIIHSPEAYLLYEAKSAIKKSLPKEAADFCFELWDAEDNNFSTDGLLAAVKGIPFMGGRMTVMLENGDALLVADLKKLRAYAQNPQAESLLIMLYNSKNPLRDFDSTKAKIITLHLDDRELPAWMRQKAREEGFELSGEAIDWLIENFNSEAGLIASEIKKLSLCGKEKMGLADIKGLSGGMAEYTAFDLVNALRSRNWERIFKISRMFTDQGDLIPFMGALNSAFKRADLPPAKGEKIFSLLAEADLKVRALGPAYPIEELLIRLTRI